MARGALIRSAGRRGQIWAALSHVRESEKERKQWLKSRRAFEEKSALGRLSGGIVGAAGGKIASKILFRSLDAVAPGMGTLFDLIFTAAGAGLGSRGGQEIAVETSKEARKRPGIGIWDVAAGEEERETEKRYRKGAMGARSIRDLQTAFWTAFALSQLPGFGKVGKVGKEFPGQTVPRAPTSIPDQGYFASRTPSLMQNLRMG